jgi:hypothetical protein
MAAVVGWLWDGVGGEGGRGGDADGGGCGMVLVERAAAAEATQTAAAAETRGWLQDGSGACSEDGTEDACLLRCSDACNV